MRARKREELADHLSFDRLEEADRLDRIADELCAPKRARAARESADG